MRLGLRRKLGDEILPTGLQRPAPCNDVLAIDGLYGRIYSPVRAFPLLIGPFGDTTDVFVDGMNLEGLTLGPALTVNGSNGWSLLSVVDSSDPYSSSKVVAFRLIAIPAPPTWLILIPPVMYCGWRRVSERRLCFR